MRTTKISLTFAVVVILVATSTRLSIAQDGATKISRLRAEAIHACSTVGAVIASITALSIWYLVRPVPLLVQGEVSSRQFRALYRLPLQSST